MDSFEINKIIAAVLLIALLVIGIGKISDIAFHVDKPDKSAYKVDIQESSQISNSAAEKIEEKVDISACSQEPTEKNFLLIISLVSSLT